MKNQNEISVKPLIQILFEQFYKLNLREFCFVVGKQKRAIEDHFTIDSNFLNSIDKKNIARKDLENFYNMIKKSNIFWANQNEPKGFGHAVLTTESFVGNQDFLVTAGDTLILKNDKILKSVINSKLEGKNDAMIVLNKVNNPKRFGVAVIEKNKNEIP